jgi:hypothetical protein
MMQSATTLTFTFQCLLNAEGSRPVVSFTNFITLTRRIYEKILYEFDKSDISRKLQQLDYINFNTTVPATCHMPHALCRNTHAHTDTHTAHERCGCEVSGMIFIARLISAFFLGREGSLQFSQETSTAPHPQPAESSPHPITLGSILMLSSQFRGVATKLPE